MTSVSDLQLRELAVLRAGRNVAPAFACGYGEPIADSGVDLQESLLAVLQLVREPQFASSGVEVDYIAIEGAIDVPTSVYELDFNGTPIQHTVVAGDTPASVMQGLFDELEAAATGYLAKRLSWPVLSSTPTEYHGMRTLRESAVNPAPSVTSGLNLVHRAAPGVNTEYRVWLRQTLADGEVVWSRPPGADFELDGGNLVERLDVAGFDRIYVQLMALPSALGSYQEAYAAPCTVEGGS